MPRAPDGTFSMPTNDSSPAVPRNVIRSSDFNELMTDIADGLTDSLSRSGDGAMLADLDMDGNDILNAPLIDAGLALAATALQPAAIGTTVQAHSANLDELAAVNAGTAGKAILADETQQDVRDYLDLKYPLVADKTGVADAAAALTAAVAASNHVRIPPGTYLIDTNVTIPATVTVEFDQGAVLNIGTGITVTWNGGIIAGPYQQIFSGDIVQSGYVRIGSTPYTFALQGTPKIPWASPVWFGADATGSSDSQEALHSAQYFGGVQYIPEGSFRTTVRLDLRQDGMKLFGEGYNSKIIVTTMTNAGSVVAFRGDPPTTASGSPARYVIGAVMEKVHIDGNDQTNVNGIGGSMAQDCQVRNCYFSNIGRKAMTFQYWGRHNRMVGNTIYEACQEASSTHAAISIEGQTAGLDWTLDGGFNGVDDKLGTDMVGNIIAHNKVYTTGFGMLTIQRAYETLVTDNHFGAASGGGTQILLADYAIRNRIAGLRCGDNVRRLIFISATTVTDNFIGDVVAGDTTGSTTDGYSIHDQGTRNTMRNISFDHSNSSTTGNRAVFIEGPDSTFDGVVIRSNDATTDIASGASAHRLTVRNCKFFTASARTMILNGDDVIVEGNYCDATSNATGIQVQGARPRVLNNRILGNASNRVLVDGTTAAPAAVVTGNTIDGASASINFSSNTLFSSVKCNNPGDVNTGDNILMGASTLWVDATGDLRVLATGTRTGDTDGTVVGTQT